MRPSPPIFAVILLSTLPLAGCPSTNESGRKPAPAVSEDAAKDRSSADSGDSKEFADSFESGDTQSWTATKSGEETAEKKPPKPDGDGGQP